MLDRTMLNDIINDMRNEKPYFKSGFSELDELLKITKQSALITIGARPVMGKTAFMLNILKYLTEQEKKCLFFSTSTRKEHITKRLLGQVAELDLFYINNPKNMGNEDWDKLNKAGDILLGWNCTIYDTLCVTVEEIEETIKKDSPNVVFIDSLQDVRTENRRNCYTSLEDIMLKLKKVAEENEVIIFVSSNLPENIEEREEKQPILSDLRVYGDIDKISDVVMFIYRDSYYNFQSPKDNAEIIVGKNIFGSNGVINLKYIGNMPKFTNK